MKIIYIRAKLNYSTLQIHSYTKQNKKTATKKIKIEKNRKDGLLWIVTSKPSIYEQNSNNDVVL